MNDSTSARLPLIPSQIGMRDGHLEDPGNAAYSEAQIIWYSGSELSEQTVIDATVRGIRDCETLLMRAAVDEDGDWYQQFDSAVDIPTHRVDLSAEEDPRAAARALADSEVVRPLELSGPELPFRSYIMNLGDDSYGWLLVCHHMFIDGYGASLLRARVGEVLAALVAGIEIPESTLGRIADLIAQVPDPAPVDLEFWKAHLDGAPDVLSFVDSVAAPAPLHAMIHVDTPHFAGRVAEVLDGANWAHVAAAAAIAYTSVIVENPAVVVGLPVTGRFSSQEKITPSQSMTTLPLHLTVDHSAPLPDLVALFRDTFRSTREHQRQAPHALRAELPVAWRTGRIYGPMVNVIPFEIPSTAGDLEDGLEVIDQGPIDDVAFTIIPGADRGIRTKFLFNPRLYEPDVRRDHSERFGRWMEQIAADPTTTLADLICLTRGEEDAHAALAGTPADDRVRPLVWGAACTVADLAAVTGAGTVTGVSVRSALGRPSIWGSPGRVFLHTPDGEHRTDLLVALDGDRLVYRGTAQDRVVVNGAHVELDAVRDAVQRDPRHAGAEVTASGRRITVRLGTDVSDTDPGLLATRIAEVTAAPVVVR